MHGIAQAAADLIQQPDLEALSEAELRAAIEEFLPLEVQQIELAGQQIRWYRTANPEPLLEEAVAVEHLPAADIDPFWLLIGGLPLVWMSTSVGLICRMCASSSWARVQAARVLLLPCAVRRLRSPIPSTWPCWSPA